MNERNIEILESIDNGRVPLLSFEVELANAALQECIGKQSELGQRLGEAMSQSSETWHDNAPADDVNVTSKVLAKTAESHINTINGADAFEFDPESDEITLGSVVKIQFGDSGLEKTLFVTGRQIRELPENISELLPLGALVASVDSPIGRSLIGCKVDDITHFSAPSGKRNIRVLDVGQISIQ